MSWSDATKGADQPKDHEDHEDQAQHSAEPTAAITAMSIIATAAGRQPTTNAEGKARARGMGCERWASHRASEAEMG